MGHLKWTLETFVKAFFEVDDIVLRMRPSYFPFTEPSAEVDVGCEWAGGRLSIGGSKDWLEILGSGMVHPRVIAACGLDPDEWQGFAFGCGRSEEHTSELQSLMRISYAVFCLKKKKIGIAPVYTQGPHTTLVCMIIIE